MADVADTGAGGVLKGTQGKLVTGGIGLILGSASTLITTQTANLGVKQLLSDNSYVGLAVFSLLTALVVFVLGLALNKPERSLTPIIVTSAVLVVAAIVFTGFSTLPPQHFPILLRAEPAMGDVPPIKISGASNGELGWEKDLTYSAERQHYINLNVQPLKDHYANQLANCVQTLGAAATGKVVVDLSKAAY